MNWEAIGAIGEVVGAVGVILTLVYLAYQIRQNTIQLEQNTTTPRAAAQTASNVTLRENRLSIFQTSEMASIFETGNSDPTKLNSTELMRYRLLMSNITEVMLEIYTQAFTTKFAQDNYPANFRATVDQILLDHDSHDDD